jgi:Ca-activated chloride channel family protein
VAEPAAILAAWQWLRPWWGLAALPAVTVAVFWLRRRIGAGDWQRVIAPALLPWLVERSAAAGGHKLPWIALAAWLSAALALAGPSWRSLPQPVYRSELPLVILFDLSPSMLAADLQPDRLTRARLKLLDLLAARGDGSTALIAYGGDAHLVTPLTDDTRTIATLAPALTPALMPVAGSAPERALALGLELLANVGAEDGDLLLITDGVDAQGAASIERRLGDGAWRLSVLAVGTPGGAPVPLAEGGFLRDAGGDIQLVAPDLDRLRELAARSGSIAVAISPDESDIRGLTRWFETRADAHAQVLDRHHDTRRDEAPWLALALLPIALAAWRRGLLTVLVIAPMMFAAPPAAALDWQDLWLRPDQRGQRALAAGDAEAALNAFRHPARRGTAAWRAGDYELAAREFAELDDATGRYNLGNALAHSGDYRGALAAYDQALAADPGLEDAAYNRALVEQLLRQQTSASGAAEDASGARENAPRGAPGDTPRPASGDHGDAETAAADQSMDTAEQGEPQPDGTPSRSAAPQTGAATPPMDAPEAVEPPHREGETEAASTAASAGEPGAQEHWLRSLSEDPGGLLRRKFLHEHRQRAAPGSAPREAEQRW